MANSNKNNILRVIKIVRNEYYKFLSENKISDMMIHIPEFSYSQKLRVLTSLKENHTNEQINSALNKYEINYVRLNRVDIKKLLNTLKGMIVRNG